MLRVVVGLFVFFLNVNDRICVSKCKKFSSAPVRHMYTSAETMIETVAGEKSVFIFMIAHVHGGESSPSPGIAGPILA
jgi:hypothetical protein